MEWPMFCAFRYFGLWFLPFHMWFEGRRNHWVDAFGYATSGWVNIYREWPTLHGPQCLVWCSSIALPQDNVAWYSIVPYSTCSSRPILLLLVTARKKASHAVLACRNLPSRRSESKTYKSRITLGLPWWRWKNSSEVLMIEDLEVCVLYQGSLAMAT